MATKRIEIETTDRWGNPAVEVRYKYEDDPQVNPDGTADRTSKATIVGPSSFASVLVLIGLGFIWF